MTYDLLIFRPTPGVDTKQEVERILDEIDERDSAAEQGEFPPLTGDGQAFREQVVELLCTACPRLTPLRPDIDAIVAEEGLTAEEAEQRYREVQLDHENPNAELDINISDFFGEIRMPYWHTGAIVEALWGEIWRCVGALTDEGFAVYDAQLDRVLRPESDLQKVKAAFAIGTDRFA